MIRKYIIPAMLSLAMLTCSSCDSWEGDDEDLDDWEWDIDDNPTDDPTDNKPNNTNNDSNGTENNNSNTDPTQDPTKDNPKEDDPISGDDPTTGEDPKEDDPVEIPVEDSKLHPEIQAALDYLNLVRTNPGAYSEEIGVDLSDVKALHKLTWNESLAKAAQDKSDDMVKREYFGHVDPDGYGMNYFINKAGYSLTDFMLRDKSNNYFESIAAGRAGGKQTIIQLVYDGGANNDNAGHRRHLLGIDEYWAECYDIGIGRTESSKGYGCYWSVLIAKHK